MSVRICFEIGHDASRKTHPTPEGFTHDFELFVRGCDGADISHYVDKVVFNLHESFPKPKRVVKEPPYAVKEAGYAGFILPVEIYFKNKGNEPKKKTYSYDMDLQAHKVQREEYVIANPSDDCEQRLKTVKRRPSAEMSLKVFFEIGHEASRKTHPTPEGYTHDFELFVRGCDGADISHYVDKVVFNLHESFPKPKRVVKESPYAVKEAGYAGFILPVEIYFKNIGDEPKKKTYSYDMDLQAHKVQREEYVIANPSDDCEQQLKTVKRRPSAEMSAKVFFEIGHEASRKSLPTPEGYTHDFELFVRGCDGVDISHYVDKVVFNLHESFPKPKRVVKEPPYAVKEAGYAGFILPVEIYFKNKGCETKKKTFSYDMDLQAHKVQREEYVIANPSDDCEQRLKTVKRKPSAEMSAKIFFEIGHEASRKTHPTPEGYTHDFGLFLRGCDGADISHYVEKVVFNLHESFTKPKRVVKEPPYAVKEAGYAGFILPVEIYFKNKGCETKKKTFSYDMDLQAHKVQREEYVIANQVANPSDDCEQQLKTVKKRREAEMSVEVSFEIGHEASLKTRPVPEGYTHDWELFVRGCGEADISHYVDKVVFNLPVEMYSEPKRVVNEPPYTLKEGGYTGFTLPIEIYYKNKKKKTFSYDMDLQAYQVQREEFVIPNPSDEFKQQLLMGGGILLNI